MCPFVAHEPFDDDRCRCPEHDPPGMIVLPEGCHTWRCPSCGMETPVIVRNPKCGGARSSDADRQFRCRV